MCIAGVPDPPPFDVTPEQYEELLTSQGALLTHLSPCNPAMHSQCHSAGLSAAPWVLQQNPIGWSK